MTVSEDFSEISADLSKDCDTAEMSKSRDTQGRVPCVMC